MGCAVGARLIGVIEAEQQERRSGSWQRNDRLVAVPGGTKGHASARSLADVDPFRLQAVESFFANYHELDEERFRVIARRGVRAAERAIHEAHEAYLTERGARKPSAASA